MRLFKLHFYITILVQVLLHQCSWCSHLTGEGAETFCLHVFNQHVSINVLTHLHPVMNKYQSKKLLTEQKIFYNNDAIVVMTNLLHFSF